MIRQMLNWNTDVVLAYNYYITAEEELKITKFIQDFKREVWLDKISGGFANSVSNIVNARDNIEIVILYGTSNDVQRDVAHYVVELDRETFLEIE